MSPVAFAVYRESERCEFEQNLVLSEVMLLGKFHVETRWTSVSWARLRLSRRWVQHHRGQLRKAQAASVSVTMVVSFGRASISRQCELLVFFRQLHMLNIGAQPQTDTPWALDV